MIRLKDIISKVLVGLVSLIIAVVLVTIIAGLVQVLSLGMDWMFNINVTPEFIETVKFTGFFVVAIVMGALVDDVRGIFRD